MDNQPATGSFRRNALIATVVALVIIFIIWNIPQLNLLLYPFRLFVTFIHEAGHGLAAILTGGQFIRFEINPDGSGVAYTAGGVRAVVLSAGYLFAAMVGAGLFYLTHTVPYPRTISIVLGVFIGVIAVVFGGVFSIATLIGVVMALALIAIGARANRDINLIALNILSVLTALNAVLDVTTLIQHSNLRLGTLHNDAAAFSYEVMPLVPASVIALVWSGLAILMLGLAIYASLIRPIRRQFMDKM